MQPNVNTKCDCNNKKNKKIKAHTFILVTYDYSVN